MLADPLKTIEDFGAVGAEDDRTLLNYFLSTPAVSQIESGRKLVVLGRKGSGKTALVKYFDNKISPTDLHISLRLGQYPWGVHSQRKNAGASDVETYSASWRYLIAVKCLSTLVTQYKRLFLSNEMALATDFLRKNYESEDVDVRQILTPNRLEIASGVAGTKLFGLLKGEINWKTAESKPDFGLLVDRVSDALFGLAEVIAKSVGIEKLFLHFDELDLGLQHLTDERRLLLTGLVIAARGIRNQEIGVSIFPIIYLRTDIWDKIDFSDKNKIAEQLAYKIVWNSSSLKSMIDRRIKSKVGETSSWDTIHDGEKMRGSQPKWDYIVSRTFLRPRDVIAYLNYALDQASESESTISLLSNDNIYKARPPYSEYLRNELHEEISPHWPDWEEPLRACSAISTMVIKRDTFNTEYEKRVNKGAMVDSANVLESLYAYSVLGYRRGLGTGGTEWIFQYSNPQAKWDPLSNQIKIHLGLKEYFGLSEKTGD